jgi:hypothetical protein
VSKLDRFFRNVRLLLNHLHGLEQLGIKFVSTQEGLDTSTPYGSFAMQIMGTIAEFEHGGSRCNLPFINADKLEQDGWEKVKAVIRNQDTLAECVNKALIELEERKSQIGAEAMAIDDKLEVIRTKKERLGLVFADGAINESVYKSKLNQLKKQETSLLKCRHNIDPAELTELSALEGRIAMVKDVLSKGRLSLTEFGIFGSIGDEYIPAGFNAWRESDGKLAIGELTEMDIFHIEGTDKVMRGIDAPLGFWECEERKEQEKHIKRNLRAILQFFNIKVIVFPERVEIKGVIPTQVLEVSTRKKIHTAPIISSPSPTSKIIPAQDKRVGEGEIF